MVLPVLYEDAWYGVNDCYIRCFACEEEEWGSFYLEIDCDGPPPNHWLAYMLDCVNLVEMLYMDPVERFIIENGIAPGQPFYLYLTYNCSQDYFGEIDEEVDYEVTSIVPWDREKVLTEWEAFYGRKIMMGWLD